MAKRPAEGEEEAKRQNALPAVTPDLMRMYYDKCFPAQQMFRWLNYKEEPKTEGDKVVHEFFSRREFSMTLPGDVYVRYKSFESPEAFAQAIKEMQPEKIDIGAVYSFPPRMHQYNLGRNFVPQERELVFDIDMDDYDDIRTSSTGKTMTKRCWSFMASAMQCLDAALREDFGFEHIIFVFSGRRGLHCWVCDESARQLPNEARGAVAEYLNFCGKGKDGQKVNLWPIKGKQGAVHPAQARAVKICERAMLTPGGILDTQAFLVPGHPRLKGVLELLPPDMQKSMSTSLNSGTWTSHQVWALLSSSLRGGGKERLCHELILEFAWPRLDIAVSKQMNHLLKGPFCVHPGTGKVCVPIAVSEASTFDPDNVPTLRSLDAALNSGAASPMEPYLKSFTRFCTDHLLDISSKRKSESEARGDF